MKIFIMSYIDTTYQVVSSIVNLQLISYQEISKHYVLTTNHEFSMCRNLKNYKGHCVKSVRIRNYSGPHLSRIFPHSDWIRRDTLIKGSIEPYNTHCVKSVRIWSYSGPHFSRIFPHLDWIRRDTNEGKCRKNVDHNNSEYGHFYAVGVICFYWTFDQSHFKDITICILNLCQVVKFREVKYTEVTSDSPKNTREKLMTLILKLISSYTYFRHQQDK